MYLTRNFLCHQTCINYSALSMFLMLLRLTYIIIFKYNAYIIKSLTCNGVLSNSSLPHGNRLLVSSVCPKKTIGRRGFATAALMEWNRLPFSVKSQQTVQVFEANVRLACLD